MLSMLVVSFEDAKQKISGAFIKKDIKELIQQVHKLHGATAYCGVPNLKELAFQYESQLKTSGSVDNMDEIHQKFISAIEDVEKESVNFI